MEAQVDLSGWRLNGQRRIGGRHLLLGLAAPFLASCAATYEAPPPGTPTATVRFVASTSIATGAAFYYDNLDCLQPKFLGSFGHERHAWQKEPLKPTFSVDLPATSPAVTYLRTLNGTKTCVVSVSFDPLPSENYEVHFDADTERCYASVVRIASDGSRQRERTALQAKRCVF